MSCYCEWGAGEGPECSFGPRMVKARKEHECCECLEPIRVGERYELETGKWDGEWRAYKTCSFCAGERTRIMRENKYCEGIAFGDLACAVYSEIIPE